METTDTADLSTVILPRPTSVSTNNTVRMIAPMKPGHTRFVERMIYEEVRLDIFTYHMGSLTQRRRVIGCQEPSLDRLAQTSQTLSNNHYSTTSNLLTTMTREDERRYASNDEDDEDPPPPRPRKRQHAASDEDEEDDQSLPLPEDKDEEEEEDQGMISALSALRAQTNTVLAEEKKRFHPDTRTEAELLADPVIQNALNGGPIPVGGFVTKWIDLDIPVAAHNR